MLWRWGHIGLLLSLFHCCVLHYKTCPHLLSLELVNLSARTLQCRISRICARPDDFFKREMCSVYGFCLRCLLIGHFVEELYDAGLLKGDRPPPKASIKPERAREWKWWGNKASKRVNGVEAGYLGSFHKDLLSNKQQDPAVLLFRDRCASKTEITVLAWAEGVEILYTTLRPQWIL